VYHLVLCAHGRAGMAGPTRQYGHGGCVLVRAGISTVMSYDTRRRRSMEEGWCLHTCMTRSLLSIAAAFSMPALDNVLAQQRHGRVPTPPCRPRPKDRAKEEEGQRVSVLPTPSCSRPHASGPWCTPQSHGCQSYGVPAAGCSRARVHPTVLMCTCLPAPVHITSQIGGVARR
jgi:hypothetical protein